MARQFVFRKYVWDSVYIRDKQRCLSRIRGHRVLDLHSARPCVPQLDNGQIPGHSIAAVGHCKRQLGGPRQEESAALTRNPTAEAFQDAVAGCGRLAITQRLLARVSEIPLNGVCPAVNNMFRVARRLIV